MLDATEPLAATTTPLHTPRSPYPALAAYIENASMGERAALARMSPDQPLRSHAMAALSRALLSAHVEIEHLTLSAWRRWALIAHGMALAGHDGKGRLGEQLARAEVAESRVNKLLTARADAFTQLLPRVLRLLVSKGVRPNWLELGPLVLQENSSNSAAITRAEHIRLGIAGAYFAQQSRDKK